MEGRRAYAFAYVQPRWDRLEDAICGKFVGFMMCYTEDTPGIWLWRYPLIGVLCWTVYRPLPTHFCTACFYGIT